MSKYRAKPVVINGIRFDSQKEGRRYTELHTLLRADRIEALVCHPSYPLTLNGINLRHVKTGRQIRYRADFEYINEDGRTIIEDVKGVRTEVYKLKAAIMLAMGKEIVEI